MDLVEMRPFLRFQRSYHGTVTVLEGAELNSLLNRFFWHMRRESGHHDDFMLSLLLCVVKSYQNLHSVDVLDEKTLEELMDPDARKVDLFYHGVLFIFAEVMYPEVDWNKEWRNKESFLQRLNEVILLKPEIPGLGISVDFNKILSKWLRKRSGEAG